MRTPTQNDLNMEYGANTFLVDVPDREVDNSDSSLALFLRSRGFDESPRRVINQHYGWRMTVGELERYYPDSEGA
jgi:hypothetical protein